MTELSETIAIFMYQGQELRFIGPFGVVGEWWNNLKEGLESGDDPNAHFIIYGTGIANTTTYQMVENEQGEWVQGDQLLQFMFQTQGDIALNGYLHTGRDVPAAVA